MAGGKTTIGLVCRGCNLELKIGIDRERLETAGSEDLARRLESALVSFAQTLNECPSCGDKNFWNATLRTESS